MNITERGFKMLEDIKRECNLVYEPPLPPTKDAMYLRVWRARKKQQFNPAMEARRQERKRGSVVTEKRVRVRRASTFHSPACRGVTG